jgi:phospholipid transport system transporter-binding protein
VSAARLEEVGRGQWRIHGELTFATVGSLLEPGRKAFGSNATVQLDLSTVTRSDSAAMALLVEWVKTARASGGELRLASVPTQLEHIARISGLDVALLRRFEA